MNDEIYFDQLVYSLGREAAKESENPFDPVSEYLDFDLWCLGFLKYFG